MKKVVKIYGKFGKCDFTFALLAQVEVYLFEGGVIIVLAKSSERTEDEFLEKAKEYATNTMRLNAEITEVELSKFERHYGEKFVSDERKLKSCKTA